MKDKRPSAALAGILAVIALWLPPSLAQGRAAGNRDPLKTLRTVLSQAESTPVDSLGRLARLVEEASQGREDQVATAILESKADGPKSRILRALMLLDLSADTYASEVVDLLKPVAEKGTKEVRLRALSLLGHTILARSSAAPEAARILLQVLLSPAAPPELKLAAARSGWAVGDSSTRRKVKKALLPFLQSADMKLRVAGALTLAEMGDISRARSILLQIRDQPTLEGRLARAFLKQDEILRGVEAWKRRFFKFNQGKFLQPGSSESSAKDPLAVDREVMAKIKWGHVEGNKIKIEDLVTASAKGMCQACDPHTAFITGKEFKRFYFDLQRDYGGIGAFVNFDENDVFGITRPIYNGPAYKAGLRSGDKILKIDGWETPRSPDKLEEIISRLKGKPGTKVTVSVYRAGWQAPKDVVITRAKVQVPSVQSQLLPGGVAYVELITFARNSALEVAKAVQKMAARGAKSLVLDLRNNTGGYLQTAVEIADLFLPPGKLVVYSKGRITPVERHFTRRPVLVPEKWPMAILVNDRTASASEILSGCLKYYGRATLVGKRTFGKGSVQQLFPLRTMPDDGYDDANHNFRHDEWEKVTKDYNHNGKFDYGPRLKLTIAFYYLPNDTCINRRYASDGRLIDRGGIEPDEVVEMASISGWKWEEIFDLMKKGIFRKYVKDHLPDHKDLFMKLALGDRRDWKLYPGFEEFYKSLKSHLTRDDVRLWIRVAVREAVADIRGKAFPGGRILGDYQEDLQLQAALKKILEARKVDWHGITAYRDTFLDEKTASNK